MFTTTKQTKPAGPRVVTCTPCAGSGAELAYDHDRAAVVIQPCFWCDGRGSHVRESAPPTCPCCARPTVPLGAECVCVTCTSYTLN